MKNHLLWKLLLINVFPVIGVIFLIVWVAVDTLAAKYFMALMEKYEVSPDDIHQMFLTSVHYYLLWASLIAFGLAALLSYLLTRRVLRPLLQMTEITREVAMGNFAVRAEVTTRDEVGQLGIAFNRMADSLERVEKLRKAMVADVAHELRTPLTNLRGYLEALNDKVLLPSSEVFTMLQDENLRLVHLVDDLQQLARADAARAFLKREEVDVQELLNQIIELHLPHLRRKEITLQTAFSATSLLVQGDRDKLLQALQNLMENCWKYTPQKGTVLVSVHGVTEGVRVSFKNSGEGISQDDLPYIFERFFRGDRSRSRDGGGAGIGLAITKELIEAHGGSVGAESDPGSTEIWFVLPR